MDFDSVPEIEEFFDSYSEFIRFYAEIAQRTDTEVLVLETELKELEIDPDLRHYWEDIVAEVRQIYDGRLAIATNWDSYQQHQFADLVDRVGVNAYFPLTEEPNPTIAQLKEAWRNCQVPDSEQIQGCLGTDWVAELQQWSSQNGVRFYFTEIGIRSHDGAAALPFTGYAEGQTVRPNEDIQAAYYEAALAVFAELEAFDGLLGWNWLPWSDAGGYGDVSFTPQNKRLEHEAPRLFDAFL